jgi:hypothetical protein
MKTCRFRDSQPRLIGKKDEEEEGLFCKIEPYARYGIMPCGHKKCFLCQSERLKSKELPMILQFSNKQIHHFINGYQAILNCSVVSSHLVVSFIEHISLYFRIVIHQILSMHLLVHVVNMIILVQQQNRFMIECVVIYQ